MKRPPRIKIAIAATALIAITLIHAQSTPKLEFEVASIRPSAPGAPTGGVRPAPGGERYLGSSVPLKVLMAVAFRVKMNQISGGSAWIDNDLWDMNAKAEHPSTVEELHTMLQNLIVDRFKLKYHREQKELPIYVLTVDKDGPKLKPHEAQSAGDPWIDQTFKSPVQLTMHAKFATMDFFAWRLAMMLDRPVANQTQLKGSYDFDLSFTRELPPGVNENTRLNGEVIDTSGPTIFEATRRQLGLRLDRQKGPVETIVIDHAEKPAEN